MQQARPVISRRRVVAAGLLALPMAGLARFIQTEDVQAANVAVNIMNFKFDPTPLTIPVGTTVVWTNQDTAPPTATSDTAGIFTTPLLQKGQSGSVTFNTPGTFTYYCTVHPNMHGTVVVTTADASSSATTGSPSAGASSSATTGSPSASAPTTTTAPATATPTTAPALPPAPPPPPPAPSGPKPGFVRRLGDG